MNPPPGFELDTPQGTSSAPPPPPGFSLDNVQNASMMGNLAQGAGQSLVGFAKSAAGIPTEGTPISSFLGRNIGPIAAQTIAAPFIAPVVASAAALGSIGGPVGSFAAGLGTESALMGGAAGLGRLAQTELQNIGSAMGTGVPQKPFGEALQEAKQEAESTGVGFGLTKGVAIPALKYGPGKLFNYLATSKIAGGIAEPAWNFFKDNVENVMSKIGATAEDADTLANDLRTSISNASQKLEDAYRAGVQKLSNIANPVKIDLQNNLGAVFKNIGDEAGFFDATRNAGTAEANFFDKNIIQRVGNLQSATPYDIYNFQKDLNRYIKDNIGTSLGTDLLKTKDALRAFIEDHPDLKSIADINNAWTTSKTIEAEAKKTTNANDLIGYVKRVFNNPLETIQKRQLEDVGQAVPEVGQGIQDVRSYLAAQELTPLSRKLPATGFGLGVPYLAGKFGVGALTNPLLAIPAAGILAGTSPRAYGLAYAGAYRALPYLEHAGQELLKTRPEILGSQLFSQYGEPAMKSLFGPSNVTSTNSSY